LEWKNQCCRGGLFPNEAREARRSTSAVFGTLPLILKRAPESRTSPRFRQHQHLAESSNIMDHPSPIGILDHPSSSKCRCLQIALGLCPIYSHRPGRQDCFRHSSTSIPCISSWIAVAPTRPGNVNSQADGRDLDERSLSAIEQPQSSGPSVVPTPANASSLPTWRPRASTECRLRQTRRGTAP
jgi:hypothetical protein